MKPTNSPTQGQPNPRKNWLWSGIWATFSHSKCVFVGEVWFYTGNRLQETQPKKVFFRKHPINSAGICLGSVLTKKTFQIESIQIGFFYESTWSFIWLVEKWITKKAFFWIGASEIDGMSIPSNWKRDSKSLFFPIRSDRIDLKWGSYPTCTACSHWDSIPEAIHRSLGTIDGPKRGDKSLTSTGGDRGNSRTHGDRHE